MGSLWWCRLVVPACGLLPLPLTLTQQDYTPVDAKIVRDTGMLGLLCTAAQCTDTNLRSLALKWTLFVFHNCCDEALADEAVAAPVVDESAAVESASAGRKVRRSSEHMRASDALLPSILQTISSKVSLAAKTSVLPARQVSESHLESLAQKYQAHCLASNTIVCDPNSPGYVSPHITIPIAHSLGFWVWRPSGSSDGVLLSKEGPLESNSTETRRNWDSLVVRMTKGHIVVTTPDDLTRKPFNLCSKQELLVDGWTHVNVISFLHRKSIFYLKLDESHLFHLQVAYTIAPKEKSMKIYINGSLSNVGELPLCLWCENLTRRIETRIIETDHPYQDDMRKYWSVEVPNAVKYEINCDSQSCTESGCDWLRFYKTPAYKEYYGLEKYTGNTFPGMNGCPPLGIEAPNFHMHFYSDGSRTDWGFKAVIKATVLAPGPPPPSSVTDEPMDISPHPFYIGQPPGYASALRAAECAVSNVYVFKRPLTDADMAAVPADTSVFGPEKARLKFSLDRNSCCTCPVDSDIPRNAFLALSAIRTTFSIVIQESGTSTEGMSFGVVLKSSVAHRDLNQAPLVFGQDAVSYGICGNAFCNSRSKKSSPIPRQLRAGDVITITVDASSAVIEFQVTGCELTAKRKFGLSAGNANSMDYLAGVLLCPGQSACVRKEGDDLAEPALPFDLQETPAIEYKFFSRMLVRIKQMSEAEMRAGMKRPVLLCSISLL